MNDDEAIAAQRALMRLSDRPGDDGLDALRGLMQAQREALAWDDCEGFSALTAPF